MMESTHILEQKAHVRISVLPLSKAGNIKFPSLSFFIFKMVIIMHSRIVMKIKTNIKFSEWSLGYPKCLLLS